MRTSFYTTLLALLIMAAPGGADEKPVTVAILDYEASLENHEQLGSQIADILTARLTVEESLALVERAELGKALDEQKLKLSGLADAEQAVKVGKLVGARVLVMGRAFVLDNKLMIVTKVVGVETGRVVGTLRQAELSKPLSDAILALSGDIAGLIRKKSDKILPKDVALPDPVAAIRKTLGDRTAAVAVVIPEEHRRQRRPEQVIDPAVETEIKRVLLDCGFTIVDVGENDLADWARRRMKDKTKPWPDALATADYVVVGEAFSEFALRTGDLVTCAGRAEVNLIDRKSGKILLADRRTTRAVDLAERIAGKTALQQAGRKLGVEIARKLARHAKKAESATRPVAEQTLADPDLLGPGVREMMTVPVGADEPASPRRTVFACPFDNETNEAQYAPAADGLADLVAVLLAEGDAVAVVERRRLAALTAEQARSLKGLTGRKHAVAAGRLLEANTALCGRLFLVDKKLHISVEALDIPTARVAAAAEIACRPEELPEAALQLSRKLAQQLQTPLPKLDRDQIDKSPIASLHLTQALGNYYTGQMDAAIMQFMRTVDLDPDLVDAHFWAGMAHHRLEDFGHAAIEFADYLDRAPKGSYAADARKLLTESRDRTEKLPSLAPPQENSTPGDGQDAHAPPHETTAKRKAAQLEAAAQRKLRLAEAYEENGMVEEARGLYRAVAETYRDTEAAKAARKRLKALNAIR